MVTSWLETQIGDKSFAAHWPHETQPSGKPSNNEPIKPPSSRSCYNSQLIFRNNSTEVNESPLLSRIPLNAAGSSLPALLRIVERAALDLRRDLETHLPGAHLLTSTISCALDDYICWGDLRTLPGSLLRVDTTDGNLQKSRAGSAVNY